MAPLPPVITQTVTDDLTPADTVVATLAQPPEETDPGPFTYALTTDAGGMFTSTGTDISSTAEVSGDYDIGATVTTGGGVSSEGTATLTFGAAAGDGDWESDDGYADNPAFPPKPVDPAANGYQYFLTMATTTLFPHARDGVDFVNARADKYSDITNIHWDDTLLGPRPTQEIEDLAKTMAAASPQLTP